MATKETSVDTRRMGNASAIVGDVAIIGVSGYDCFIDAEDYDKVSTVAAGLKWFAKVDSRDGHKRVVIKRGGKEIPLRRVVANATADMVVLHLSGDGLDCRKSNLKVLLRAPQDAPVLGIPACPEGAVLIPLNRSFAIIDKADSARVRGYHWGERADGYVAAHVTGSRKHGRMVRLHRLVIDAKDGEIVDHINGDPLDNRRANLRVCSNTQNIRNSKKQRRSTSPYKGITRGRAGTYRAQICVNHRKVNLGNYPTPEAAAKAYDDAALKIFGEFARPNFRPEASAPLRQEVGL